MIWHEFLRRFKPKAITTLWVFGPILLYELFGMVLEYFRIPPIGIRETLTAAIAVLLVLALACWLWVVGEWAWFSSRPKDLLKKVLSILERTAEKARGTAQKMRQTPR